MIRTRVLFVCGNGLQALNKIRNVVRAAGREDACQNHAKPWDSKRYAQCIVNIRTRRHAQRAADNQRCQLRGGGVGERCVSGETVAKAAVEFTEVRMPE